MLCRIALALALCAAGVESGLAQLQFQPGDLAAVAAGGVPLMQNKQVVGQLPEGAWFEIVRTSGGWAAGYAYQEGRRRAGWAPIEKLLPESMTRQADAAAAWEQAGATVEKDASGAVLTIDAADSNASDAEMAQLKFFPRLEEISLGGSRITESSLSHLAGLPRLRRVFLDGLTITQAGAKTLGQLVELEGLSLANTKANDAALATISGLTKLQVLNLTNCDVSDAGLAHLEPLVSIETLALRNTKVRGPGLAHLRGMKWLNVLNLSECPLEGAHLMHLGGMEHLRILHIADCHVEQSFIDDLEANSTSLAVFD